ncbi:MAG: glycosyltransferase [Halanaerobiales bacterium]|nr:glycosyltransferase [Halanaerobiales bacterium]
MLIMEKEDFLISVIMPAFNTKDFIYRAIGNVKMQTYKNYELIVIDDMSTDGTREILEKIDDIILIKNDHKRLAGGSRNAGLDVAKGDYVLFIDSDDAYHNETRFKRVAEDFKESPDVIFMGYRTNEDHQFVPDGKTYMSEVYNMCAVWNKCWKRSFIGDYRFDETMLAGEDLLFTKHLCLQENVKYKVLSEVVYVYTKNRVGSITLMKIPNA